MKDLNKNEEAFYAKWEVQRKNKWKYVLLHGPVYIGIPLGVILFVASAWLASGGFDFLQVPIYVLIASIVCLPSGFSEFKRNDKMYFSMNDDDEILAGIKELESGETWNHENLEIHEKDNETLVVKNELFWFNEDEVSSEKMNESFGVVLADFQRLQKNESFQKYANGKKIMVQIFDNSSKEEALIEKFI